MKTITRDEAFTLLKKYNKDPFHIQHALTVEAVMKWYANELGYGEDAEYWGIVGLLHDIDFELYPEEHCLKAPELLRKVGVSEDVIHSVVSHGFGITVGCGTTIDVEPVHEMEKVLFDGTKTWKEVYVESKNLRKKMVRQFGKDYVLFPLIAGPMFLPVLAGNFVANLIRNYWASTVIYCGHFTEDSEIITDNIDNETKAEWYLRQIRGSANFTGGKIMHFLSGNLSHQIEHHLFPDVPANRYQEMAPKVRAVCAEFGQQYNTAPFGSQIVSVYKRLAIHSLPDNVVDRLEAIKDSFVDAVKSIFGKAA